MAKEEKETNIPPLIDYESSIETTPDTWNSTNFEAYWRRTLVRTKGVGSVPWTIKDKSLSKRLLQEFGHNDYIDMIDWWIKSTPIDKGVTSFVSFYSNRYNIYKATEKKDYSEWET